MNRLTTLLSLSALLTFSTASADHQLHNLKNFRSVCVNTFVEIKDTEDAAQLIYNAIADQLEEAGIVVANSPCQADGTAARRQVSLLYSFTSTSSGRAYLGTLEGWLQQDGPYTSPVIWNDFIHGSTGKTESLDALAEDLAAELTDSFLDSWDENH